jgi:predicted nuclease of predicted toxin-antitoxin system
LYIELYLDEDVDVLLADLVRARGFEAMTTREAGQLHSSDPAQLAYAASEHKTFLTHNRTDFEILAQQNYAAGMTHSGIIIAVRRSPFEIARRLLIVINQVTADEMQNQMLYI